MDNTYAYNVVVGARPVWCTTWAADMELWRDVENRLEGVAIDEMRRAGRIGPGETSKVTPGSVLMSIGCVDEIRSDIRSG
ncbi:hypothetical protein GCM10009743_25780 [Kribbella swartbergensis]